MSIMKKFILPVLIALATNFSTYAIEEVYLDTMICKEQILFGDTFMVAGTFQKTTTGITESGSPIDTIWNIEVVDINLRLRIFADKTELKPGDEVTLNATIKTYDTKGRHCKPSKTSTFILLFYCNSISYMWRRREMSTTTQKTVVNMAFFFDLTKLILNF